ncbi:MAG TPA: DUF1330 domain-containing protein [Verrucomicrobiae bacterium]|jgi:uncharacterized protein (DUF1330 family)
MAAYFVFIREHTTDKTELDIYESLAPTTLEGHKISVLAHYGKHQVLEGAEAEGVVIAEFPTAREAMAWYDSPEYKRVREHRFRGAEYRAILVEGLPTQ